jgi:hypothetical protein
MDFRHKYTRTPLVDLEVAKVVWQMHSSPE